MKAWLAQHGPEWVIAPRPGWRYPIRRLRWELRMRTEDK